MSNALGYFTSLSLNWSMNLEVFDKVVVTQERKRIENKRPQGYIFPNLRAERYRERKVGETDIGLSRRFQQKVLWELHLWWPWLHENPEGALSSGSWLPHYNHPWNRRPLPHITVEGWSQEASVTYLRSRRPQMVCWVTVKFISPTWCCPDTRLSLWEELSPKLKAAVNWPPASSHELNLINLGLAGQGAGRGDGLHHLRIGYLLPKEKS